MNQLCKVCGEPAAGFHFGAFTCEGCKSFFGRTYNNVSGVSECKNGGRCEITKKNRTSCKSCRLRKCLSVGMSKSGSRYGRRSNWFKIHCLLSAQNQNGMGSGSETNNNNSTVTNNNTGNGGSSSMNSLGLGKGLPSSLSSLNSMGNLGGEGERRTPASSASRINGGAPPAFTSLAGLSPESREQFLSSLNRNMGNPELCEYFSRANNSKNNSNSKPFYSDEAGEDMSRSGRSPGSLESPNSEASMDDKSSTPMFTIPPGSPLDVKPNDFSPLDLIFTRDLMKLGYDPLRLWPAMLGSSPNIHPALNPYRFIFPNFPGTPGFPGAFPSNPPPQLVVPPNPTNGSSLHSAKMLSAAAAAAAAAAAENLSLPLTPSSGMGGSGNRDHHRSSSSPNLPSPSNQHVVSRRFNSVVPPSSSLTLTPPISHHGSDEHCYPGQKFRSAAATIQDAPIDLSARSVNNNNVGDLMVRVKGEILSSDMEDDEQEDNSERDIQSEEEELKHLKSEYRDSDEDEDEDDRDSILGRRKHRRSSQSSCSPKRERVTTPLDLTCGTNNNNNNSPPKIAT